MKIYLIAVLFLAALVVAHAEDEKVELPKELDQPEQLEKDLADGGDGTEGDSNEDSADGGDGTEGDSNEEASEDESVDKRRIRNTLSNPSCLWLRRRGYCRRYSFIRNLCRFTCPVCRDKLSSISCRRIRFTYPRCNTAFGRYFCARTCGHCGVPHSCRNYAVLNQLNRRQSRHRGNTLLCDQRGFARRWYRFTGLAGNRMPTRAPRKNRCGTHAPGWMVGSYPRRRGQVVRRKVCYHWGNKTCNWHNFIKVKNCGSYFLFYLSPTPVCHLRYCGNA